MPPGIACPDKVETRLGTLNFFDGFPDQASADKLLNNLDFQRAVQAYLLAIPAVSQVADRNACLTLGAANQTIPIWEQLVDSRTIGLTFNDNTVYSWGWLNLKKGPLVVEVPPKVLGAVNDIWFRWVIDVGITGPDKGKGGKYLFLPPGYKGDGAQRLPRRSFPYLQSLDSMAEFPGERRPETRHRTRQEAHQNLSARRQGQTGAAAQVR